MFLFASIPVSFGDVMEFAEEKTGFPGGAGLPPQGGWRASGGPLPPGWSAIVQNSRPVAAVIQ
jgi:hypothetical protein